MYLFIHLSIYLGRERPCAPIPAENLQNLGGRKSAKGFANSAAGRHGRGFREKWPAQIHNHRDGHVVLTSFYIQYFLWFFLRLTD